MGSGRDDHGRRSTLCGAFPPVDASDYSLASQTKYHFNSAAMISVAHLPLVRREVGNLPGILRGHWVPFHGILAIARRRSRAQTQVSDLPFDSHWHFLAVRQHSLKTPIVRMIQPNREVLKRIAPEGISTFTRRQRLVVRTKEHCQCDSRCRFVDDHVAKWRFHQPV
jgi:hypothetical protein